jgi:hypothetical protein
MGKFILIGLITTFLSLQLYSQVKSPVTHTAAQKDWKTLNEKGYSIQYPDNWELNTSGQMSTSFILFSKQTSPQDQFRENVNLIIQDLTKQNINLDKYVEISEGQVKTMITNGKLIESKRLNSNGIDFQKVIYTGDQGTYKLKFEQYYLIKKNKAYVLTLTCETRQFDAYKEIGEQILNSFILK